MSSLFDVTGTPSPAGVATLGRAPRPFRGAGRGRAGKGGAGRPKGREKALFPYASIVMAGSRLSCQCYKCGSRRRPWPREQAIKRDRQTERMGIKGGRGQLMWGEKL